ncbi:MAG: hypothetical protein K9G58_14845 [Bacteroidales bacterium]|nr:hypothetical protein [Bacteroidales bacterium]
MQQNRDIQKNNYQEKENHSSNLPGSRQKDYNKSEDKEGCLPESVLRFFKGLIAVAMAIGGLGVANWVREQMGIFAGTILGTAVVVGVFIMIVGMYED